MRRRKEARNAQIIGQVFVLILAAIIFILILTFGYRAIRNILADKEKVELVDVTQKLRSAVDEIRLSYGSIKKLSLSGLPGKYKEICFVTGQRMPVTQLEDLEDKSPIINNLYQPDGTQNVFLIPSAPQAIFLDKIEAHDVTTSGTPPSTLYPDRRWFCTQMDQGEATLCLKGIGDKVWVSEWPCP